MLPEVLLELNCSPGKNYIDFTLGGGGHAEAILGKTSPDGTLVGVDRDEEALTRAKKRLAPYGSRFVPVHSEMGKAKLIFEGHAPSQVDGVLMDLGVSSDQLESERRGFSFQKEGPLDMRMDPSQGFTGIEWLSSAKEEEIADTLYKWGDERFSRRIAKRIMAARKLNQLKTTSDLAKICFDSYPIGARHGKIHPATRTFQAVRMLVNSELSQLETALEVSLQNLFSPARMVVLTFHSHEDRIVKSEFRAAEKEGVARNLTKKPLTPSSDEISQNPRARSAKLRGVELLRRRT
jgi:16S rRNA (cytosine1402-N4)-methyltransferase